MKTEVAILLVDVCMPELDGFQLAGFLRMQLQPELLQSLPKLVHKLIGLILGVASQACARNGFGERRDRVPKIAATARL